jgi:hypothetical protein
MIIAVFIDQAKLKAWLQNYTLVIQSLEYPLNRVLEKLNLKYPRDSAD